MKKLTLKLKKKKNRITKGKLKKRKNKKKKNFPAVPFGCEWQGGDGHQRIPLKYACWERQPVMSGPTHGTPTHAQKTSSATSRSGWLSYGFCETQCLKVIG